MKILTACSLVLAAGAIAIAIVALNRRPPTIPRANVQLVQRVEDLSDKVDAIAGEASASERLAGKLGKLITCLPELAGEINGLTPEVTGGSVYLSQHSQISSYCAPVLEASSGPR